MFESYNGDGTGGIKGVTPAKIKKDSFFLEGKERAFDIFEIGKCRFIPITTDGNGKGIRTKGLDGQLFHGEIMPIKGS